MNILGIEFNEELEAWEVTVGKRIFLFGSHDYANSQLIAIASEELAAAWDEISALRAQLAAGEGRSVQEQLPANGQDCEIRIRARFLAGTPFPGGFEVGLTTGNPGHFVFLRPESIIGWWPTSPQEGE